MKLITIVWRDIPSQVIVKAGRTKAKVQLPHRFQAAIDRAAMRAGKGGSQAYLEAWQRITHDIPSSDDPSQIARDAAAAIDARYSNQDLDLLIKNNGLEPDQPTAAHIQS
ncbi:MAG: virulence factor [Pseudomonadales bacterium]|jgi:beta-phosphoglucomutase-like phosphatase (HAD superfamily)